MNDAHLPISLIISVGGATDPGRIVFTLRGEATVEDKEYYAAVTLGVVEVTKRKRKDEES